MGFYLLFCNRLIYAYSRFYVRDTNYSHFRNSIFNAVTFSLNYML